VLNDAQALAAAASAAQADAVKALTEQWTRLSVSLPAEVTVLSIRIDALGKKSGKRQAAGIDLDAARAALADASSLWSKAQAAFASDNLREAVSTANTVGSKLESLAATLKLDLGTAS
jgi:cobalamin biosynthesis protein CbiD